MTETSEQCKKIRGCKIQGRWSSRIMSRFSMVSQLIHHAILLVPSNTIQIKEYSFGSVIALKQFFFIHTVALARGTWGFFHRRGACHLSNHGISCIYGNFHFAVFNSKPRCCHKIMFEKNIILFSVKLFTKYQCQNHNVFALICLDFIFFLPYGRT